MPRIVSRRCQVKTFLSQFEILQVLEYKKSMPFTSVPPVRCPFANGATMRLAVLLCFLTTLAAARHVKILLPGAAGPVAPPVKQGGCKVDPGNYAKSSCGSKLKFGAKQGVEGQKQPSCYFCKDDVSDRAGWKSDIDSAAEKLAQKHFSSCSIDRVDAATFTKETFKRDYEGKKPFILNIGNASRTSMSKTNPTMKHGKRIINRPTVSHIPAFIIRLRH